jgi:hypothetical protein
MSLKKNRLRKSGGYFSPTTYVEPKRLVGIISKKYFIPNFVKHTFLKINKRMKLLSSSIRLFIKKEVY